MACLSRARPPGGRRGPGRGARARRRNWAGRTWIDADGPDHCAVGSSARPTLRRRRRGAHADQRQGPRSSSSPAWSASCRGGHRGPPADATDQPGGHGHLGLLASIYFTVETVATVGFGDYSLRPQSAWLQVFAIALIVVGVTLVTTTFALFTNILVSRRIEQSLGRRQVPGMAGHVVVVGLGSVGIRVVEGLLAEGRQVVVVERDDSNRYLDRARALGVPVVIGDATQRQTHTMVNLADASAVAILTSDDLTNIETGLAVRESLGDRWEEVPVVLRVFDRAPGPDDGAELRFPPRPVHLRPGRAVVRRRRPRPRRPRDLLRRPAALPGRPSADRPRRRAAGPGHAGPVGPDPGHRPAAGRRRPASSSTHLAGAPASRAATRPTCSAPTRSCSGPAPGPVDRLTYRLSRGPGRTGRAGRRPVGRPARPVARRDDVRTVARRQLDPAAATGVPAPPRRIGRHRRPRHGCVLHRRPPLSVPGRPTG